MHLKKDSFVTFTKDIGSIYELYIERFEENMDHQLNVDIRGDL